MAGRVKGAAAVFQKKREIKRANIPDTELHKRYRLLASMLCTVGVGRYMFRVGREQKPKTPALPGAAIMEMSGRRMHDFVRVQAEHARGRALQKWINLALAYVGSLPAK